MEYIELANYSICSIILGSSTMGAVFGLKALKKYIKASEEIIQNRLAEIEGRKNITYNWTESPSFLVVFEEYY